MGKPLFNDIKQPPFTVEHFNKEEWKVHPEFPDYWISNHGRIISKPNSKRHKFIFVHGELAKGYHRVTLRKATGIYRRRFVHRLVAELFIENPYGLSIVNHINEFPWDCNVENLEWCTASHNEKHGTKRFRASKLRSKSVVGINIQSGIEIKATTISNLEELGFSATHICQCCKGTRKSHKGYVWRYCDDKTTN